MVFFRWMVVVLPCIGISAFSMQQAAKTSSVVRVDPVQRVYETWHWQHAQRSYRINYRVEGNGRPLLLVHGFGANMNHFRFQFPALVAAGYKVYAIDLLGFGASEKPTDARSVGFSIELFSQQMIDFMVSQNEQESWILAGNSIGGLCSLAVAARQPSLPIDIASIVLFNTSGGMTGFRYQDLPIWAHPLMGHAQYFLLGDFHGPFLYRAFASRENIERVLKEGVYQDSTNVDEQLLQILLGPAADEGAENVFLAVFGGPPGPTRESLLPDVKVPVLALWGSEDTFTPYNEDVRAMPELHGSNDFHLTVIEGAGHCLHDECPDVVNEKMISFLRERVAA